MFDNSSTSPSTGKELLDLDFPALMAVWLGEAIPELEEGVFNGKLAELLEQPDFQEVLGAHLLEKYKKIATDKLKHDQVFRRNWIRRLIFSCQERLQPPRKLFSAIEAIEANQKKKWLPEDASLPAIKVNHFQGEVILRPDQVFAARGWGNWFQFGNDTLESHYMDCLVDLARQRLASDIKNLWSVEATFLSGHSNLDDGAKWRPSHNGRLMEHLMLDVLNEHAEVARFAPFAEDILERTDLRVSIPGVKVKHGARVQVSIISNPEVHQQKVEDIYLADEFVILTPLELAKCALSPPNAPNFKILRQHEFWDPLGGRCHDEVQLANQMSRLFVDAFSFSHFHPYGPMWMLPTALRQFIRAFTEYRATETGKCIHDRLEKSTRVFDSVGKYTSPYWKAKFSTAPDQIKKTSPSPKICQPKIKPVPKTPENKVEKQPCKVEPATVLPEPVEKTSPMSNVTPAKVPGWKIRVCYVESGRTNVKNIGQTLLDHGHPTSWTIPGPIHHWLKERLVAAKIPMRGIEKITAEEKTTTHQVDFLLEHLPLSQAEIDSCRM